MGNSNPSRVWKNFTVAVTDNKKVFLRKETSCISLFNFGEDMSGTHEYSWFDGCGCLFGADAINRANCFRKSLTLSITTNVDDLSDVWRSSEKNWGNSDSVYRRVAE